MQGCPHITQRAEGTNYATNPIFHPRLNKISRNESGKAFTSYEDARMPLRSHAWSRSQSYAQWVREALRIARSSERPVVPLFESSVPEPRVLLQRAIERTVCPDFGPLYASAFGGGNPHVVALIADRYGVPAEQVLCTTGATGSLSLLYAAFTDPGDQILVETPGFDLFSDLAESRGLEPIPFVRSAPDFGIDLREIESKITDKTRLIVLSNLHNPSGMALAHEDLVALAGVAERNGILVVVDEVYADYAEPGAIKAPACSISPFLVSVSSLTKNFALSALRCGWIVGARSVMDTVRELSTRVEFGVSTLCHSVAATVLTDRNTFDSYRTSMMAQCRPIFEQWFEGAKAEGLVSGKLPGGSCICFLKLPQIANTEQFCRWLVQEHAVVVAPGECFGAPGYVRIGFAHPTALLERGLQALSAGISQFAQREAKVILMRETG